MPTLRQLAAVPVLCGSLLAAFPTTAQAQSAAADPSLTDAVELKNGGYLRGLIVEVDPASHLTMRLPDGQVRRIPIAEVASADHGGKPINLGAAPSPPAPTPSAVPAAPAPTPAATPAAPAAP